MKDAVLCVDIGSTSLKAAYMADSPKSIAYARCNFSKDEPQFLANQWIPALKECLEELKEKSPQTGIEAICISGNGPTVVDSEGLTLMWSQKISTTVKDSKSQWISRLDGFRKHYPQQWFKSKHFFGAPEFLIYCLTGNVVTILPEERFKEIYWTQEQLKSEGFSDEEINKLPPFVAPGSLAGKVTREAAMQTGLLEGTLVFCGAPDFIVALIGTDTLETSKLCDRSGSSEGINLCTPFPIESPNVRVVPSIIPGMWNASVLIADSGKRFADFKEKTEQELNIKLTHKNIIAQLTGKTDEKQILTEKQKKDGMAIIHDVTHQLWAAVNILKKAASEASIPVPTEMTITGGQALNEIWTQLKCDSLCLPIIVTECVDAELVGDNILARIALGDYDSIEEAAFALVKKAKTYTPSIPADFS